MALDFSSQAHFLIALGPELVLSVWGMVILILGVSKRQQNNPDASTDLGWMSLIGVLVAASVNGWLYGISEVGTESMIAVDPFALFANWIFLAALGLGILISLVLREGATAPGG